MNDPIYEEFRTKIKIPEMNISDMVITEHDSIIRHISTKQIIQLSAEEIKEILAEKEINLPRYLLKFDDGLRQSNLDAYKEINDGYQISEYFSNSNIFITTFDYFRAVKFGSIDFIMNLYNGEKSNIPFKQITDKIKSSENSGIYEIMLPFPTILENTIKYSYFTEIKYEHKNRINKYMYRFPSLCVNLPYEYYSTQLVPENILTWDIDTKELKFTNKSLDSIIELFNSICKDGFTEPLYFQISQGKIVSASDDDFIRLIIAQYLKLPTIPVVLYALNNSKVSDMLTSMRPCDIINCNIRNNVVDKNTYDMINNICNPYLIFYNNEYYDIEHINFAKDKLYKQLYRHKDINEFYLIPN